MAPGLKPYKQHESTVGFDYQIRPTLAFEARYDRRRLDHVIEDSALVNPGVGETFVIVNPGQGVNTTYNKFLQLPVRAAAGTAGRIAVLDRALRRFRRSATMTALNSV